MHIMHVDRAGGTGRVRRLAWAIRKREPVAAVGLHVADRAAAVPRGPRGAARAEGGELPVGGVGLGAGFEEGEGGAGVGLGG